MVEIALPTSLYVAWEHGARVGELGSAGSLSDAEGAELRSLLNEVFAFTTVVTGALSSGAPETRLASEWIAEWNFGNAGKPFFNFPDDPSSEPGLPDSGDDPCHLAGQRLLDAIGDVNQLNAQHTRLAQVDIDAAIANQKELIGNLQSEVYLNIFGNGAIALSQSLSAVGDALANFVAPEFKLLYKYFGWGRDGGLLVVDTVRQVGEAVETNKVRIDPSSLVDTMQLAVALKSESSALSIFSTLVDAGQAIRSGATTVDEALRISDSLTTAYKQLAIFEEASKDQTAIAQSLQNAYDAVNRIFATYTGSCVSEVIFQDGELVSPEHPVGSPPPHADTSTLDNIAPIPDDQLVAPDLATLTRQASTGSTQTVTPLPAASTPNMQIEWQNPASQQTIILGTLKGDTIVATSDTFILCGAGDDVITANGSGNMVFCGYGNKTIDFGEGNKLDSAAFS